MAKEQEPCKKLLDEFIFIVNEILFNVQEEIKYTKRSNQKITLFNRLDTLSDALEVKIWNYIQRSRFKDYYYKEEKIFSGQVLINKRIGQDYFLDKFLYNGRFYDIKSCTDEFSFYEAREQYVRANNNQEYKICTPAIGNSLGKLFLDKNLIEIHFENCKQTIKACEIEESYDVYIRDLIKLKNNINKIIDSKELTIPISTLNDAIYSVKEKAEKIIFFLERGRQENKKNKIYRKIPIKHRAYFLYRLFTEELLMDESQEVIGKFIATLVGCEETSMIKYINQFKLLIAKENAEERKKFRQYLTNINRENIDELFSAYHTQVVHYKERNRKK